MAALSLTEIQDAFLDDEGAGGFGSEAPMQHMPDHQKKSNPVTPRLAETTESAKRRRERKEAKNISVAAKNVKINNQGAGRSELLKLVANALVLTVGLALNFAITRTMTKYFDENYVGSTNQMIVAFIYPLATLLLLWHLKSSA
jgi:hypothetical protein